MDFAPYQDQSPETHRALSPPPGPSASGTTSRPSLEDAAAQRRSFSPALRSPTSSNPPAGGAARASANPWAATEDPRSGFGDHAAFYGRGGGEGVGVQGGWGVDRGDVGDVRGRLNEFETSLPIRLDYEACLAYLLLPPAGGVLLLVMEHKSDFVRFHAWQSALLFSALFVLHLLLLWSKFLSWVLFIGDIALIGFLTLRAYRDAETLDRFEVPYIGALASRILDDE